MLQSSLIFRLPLFISLICLSITLRASPNAVPGSTDTPPNAASLQLPDSIKTLMEESVDQGVCEDSWVQMAVDLGIIQQASRGMTIWLVPCARWAVNQAWSVFVVINEPAHVGGIITKPIHFANYSVYEGLVAQDVAYNIHWDPVTLILTTEYHPNGNPICGSLGQYRWDAGYENFELTQLLVQGDCEAPGKPWVKIEVPN